MRNLISERKYMNESFDLNIENYTLSDLLNLFKLPEGFDENDLKRAKKHVVRLHPDKSQLPKEYFIFFAKAYKYIQYIYEFRMKSNSKETDYSVITGDSSSSNKLLIEKAKNQQNFSIWFNKMFEEHSLDTKEDGYEDWLKEECDDLPVKASNRSQLHENFNQYKERQITSLVKHNGINDVYQSLSAGSSEIVNKNTGDFSNTNIFSESLQFNDVKKAHTETFIPVSESDYSKRKQYNSVFELNHERETQQMHMPSMEQSKQMIRQREAKQQQVANEDAFRLLQNHEKQEQLNNRFWQKLQLLK